MAVSYNNELVAYREGTGQTNGNEVFFKLNPAQTYVVSCVVTSAGTGSLMVMTGDNVPTDFTTLSIAYDGTQSANFMREVTGCSYVALDVASGTWTVKVRRV